MRFATFVLLLTFIGVLPAGTLSSSAVEPVTVLLLVTFSAEVLAEPEADSSVGDVAVFGTPRMKLPPVAAMPTPPSDTNSARSETTMDGDDARRSRFSMSFLLP